MALWQRWGLYELRAGSVFLFFQADHKYCTKQILRQIPIPISAANIKAQYHISRILLTICFARLCETEKIITHKPSRSRHQGRICMLGTSSTDPHVHFEMTRPILGCSQQSAKYSCLQIGVAVAWEIPLGGLRLHQGVTQPHGTPRHRCHIASMFHFPCRNTSHAAPACPH